MVLLPSYLMHATPPNASGRRMTLAFNEVPTYFDSRGDTIAFSG